MLQLSPARARECGLPATSHRGSEAMLLMRWGWSYVCYSPKVTHTLCSNPLNSQAECPSLRVQGGGQKCYVRAFLVYAIHLGHVNSDLWAFRSYCKGLSEWCSGCRIRSWRSCFDPCVRISCTTSGSRTEHCIASTCQVF